MQYGHKKEPGTFFKCFLKSASSNRLPQAIKATLSSAQRVRPLSDATPGLIQRKANKRTIEIKSILHVYISLNICLKYETLEEGLICLLKNCEKEIAEFPVEIRGDLADALARLDQGQKLSMPLSRPMPSIGKGVHEIRLKDRTGIYRVIYMFIGTNHICLLHAFIKKTQSTPKQNIDLAKKRLKEALK